MEQIDNKYKQKVKYKVIKSDTNEEDDKDKDIKLAPLLGIGLFTIGMIISDLQLIMLFVFDHSFASHRSNFSFFSEPLKSVMNNWGYMLWNEKYAHLATLHHIILFWLLLIILLIKKINRKYFQPIYLLLIIIIINTFFATMLGWDIFASLKIKFNILNEFGFN